MTTNAVRFPTASGTSELPGVVHAPAGPARAGLVVAHGRSGSMQNALVRRVGEAAALGGIWALRFNFRYVEAKGRASRDLSQEVDDLLGSVRLARTSLPSAPIFAAGQSMGARVCAKASSDAEVAGVIALGYPLHPRFKPEVRNPPEWPHLVKPALFVQGDRDPFCDLGRLKDDFPRLAAPYDLVVIRDAGHSFEPIGAKRDTFPEVIDAVLEWIAGRPSVGRRPPMSDSSR